MNATATQPATRRYDGDRSGFTNLTDTEADILGCLDILATTPVQHPDHTRAWRIVLDCLRADSATLPMDLARDFDSWRVLDNIAGERENEPRGPQSPGPISLRAQDMADELLATIRAAVTA